MKKLNYQSLSKQLETLKNNPIIKRITQHRSFILCNSIYLLTMLWASDLFAGNAGIDALSQKLDHLQTFAKTKVATTGLTVVMIIGCISARIKGSLGAAIAVIGIGIVCVYMVDWIGTAFTVGH